jgi:hypothetical protein
VRIAAVGRGIEEAVVEGAVCGGPVIKGSVVEGAVFERLGSAVSGGEAMFFASEDACKEEYPGLYSKSGLDKGRWPLHLSISKRPEVWISRSH